ncbi:MAG: hypothetical protein EPN22_01515 [Nitrospirae bacterium]|nr:MAG: hypothetical protein EPN22_01515 [Nitrospirota bacterium]
MRRYYAGLSNRARLMYLLAAVSMFIVVSGTASADQPQRSIMFGGLYASQIPDDEQHRHSAIVMNALVNKNSEEFKQLEQTLDERFNKFEDTKKPTNNRSDDFRLRVISNETNNCDVILRDMRMAFFSIDDVLCFEGEIGHNVHKISAYVVVSFYSMKLNTMNLVYSRNFIVPLQKSLEILPGDNKKQRLEKAYGDMASANSGALKEALLKSLDMVMNDPNFVRGIYNDKYYLKSGFRVETAFSKANDNSLIKSERNREDFIYLSTYMAASRFASEAPILPPLVKAESKKMLEATLQEAVRESLEQNRSKLPCVKDVEFKPEYKALKDLGDGTYGFPYMYVPESNYVIKGFIKTESSMTAENELKYVRLYGAGIKFMLKTSSPVQKEYLDERNKKGLSLIAVEKIEGYKKSTGESNYYEVILLNTVVNAIVDGPGKLSDTYDLQKIASTIIMEHP